MLEGFEAEGFLRCPRLLPTAAPDVGFLLSLLDVSCCSSVISFVRLRYSMRALIFFLRVNFFLSVDPRMFTEVKRAGIS